MKRPTVESGAWSNADIAVAFVGAGALVAQGAKHLFADQNRPIITIETGGKILGGLYALAQLLGLHSCVPTTSEVITPTPKPDEIFSTSRDQVQTISSSDNNLSTENRNIITDYVTAFSANPFIQKNGYILQETYVIKTEGINQKNQPGMVEMATTLALVNPDDPNSTAVFFQFRDDNKTPNPSELDLTAKLYLFTTSDPKNVTMEETSDGIVVNFYGIEVLPTQEQQGKSLRYVMFQSMVFDKNSPHGSLKELLESGTLLSMSIINPVTMEQINIAKNSQSLPQTGNVFDIKFMLDRGLFQEVSDAPLPAELPLPATETPTPTATATPTETLIPTPTETPRMTLEDWKEVFTGPYIAGDGIDRDLGLMFREDINAILTDPNQVKMLPVGSPITILNPDGTIIIYSDPDVAAERVEKGAIVLVWQMGPTPSGIARYALTAAALQYQKGNKNIYVQFSENSIGEFPFNARYGISIYLNRDVFQITLDDGTIITPIMAMPKHFEVTHGYDLESLTLEQAGIVITNPDNWLDQVLKAGYDTIFTRPW